MTHHDITPGFYVMPARCRSCGEHMAEEVFIGRAGWVVPARALTKEDAITEPTCERCMGLIDSTARRLLRGIGSGRRSHSRTDAVAGPTLSQTAR
mgnify:FL=1